jgi:anaerobic selenocysteine-containing dehydrogenase
MPSTKHGFFCFLCGKHCSLLAHVEDGRVVKVTGDHESGLFCDICPDAKGPVIIPESYNHPDRLKYPLKRVGEKGSGRWERISWDEALETISGRIKHYMERFGPESIAMVLGEPKGLEFAFGQRFATVLGTPNVITPGCYCGVQTGFANHFTYGSMLALADDNVEETKAVMLWGTNPRHIGGTFNGMMPSEIDARLKNGCKLIVVDPGKIDFAEKADIWIRPKPGMDGVLALGMIKAIIEERLYDADFVARWTTGFSELKTHVSTFSLEDVERESWVPKSQIVAAARMFALNGPCILGPGNALEGTVAALQTCRAVAILNGLTGSVGVPGGLVIKRPAKFQRPGSFYFPKGLPRNKEDSIARDFILAVGAAYVPTQTLVKTIESDKPYGIKAALCFVTNPLSTYPDAVKTYEAFMKLNFMVVVDIFHTPTTAIADIVLPAALPGEHATIAYWPAWTGYLKCDPKFTDPPGEAWSDMKIINELAKRLGLREHFWEDENEVLDYWLKPSGITYEQFKEVRLLSPEKIYLKGNEGSFFQTPSGKMEIYSEQMAQLGISPLPYYEEVLKAKQVSCESGEYPLLMTNRKERGYMLSGYRTIRGMRRKYPEAVVELHPETAGKAGVEEGDMVWIETPKGRVRQKVKLEPDLDPRVIMAGFGWWYPEEPATQYDWRKSNINLLIDYGPEELATGATHLRGIPCRIYREPA